MIRVLSLRQRLPDRLIASTKVGAYSPSRSRRQALEENESLFGLDSNLNISLVTSATTGAIMFHTSGDETIHFGQLSEHNLYRTDQSPYALSKIEDMSNGSA